MKPVPFDLGCEPSPSVPAETLLQNGWRTFLLFWAVCKEVGSQGTLEDLGVAIAEFQNCVKTRFGYPNDEGLPEHELYDIGLERAGSSIMQIVDSPWVLETQNQLDRSYQRIWGGRGEQRDREPDPLLHLLVTLKDRTFECIASSVTVEFASDFGEAYSLVIARLSSE